jgi:hypothetical protein
MRRRNQALIGVSLAAVMAASISALLALNGCTLVPVNPSDMNPPSVVIKVKGPNGQYAAATTASVSGSSGTLNLICVVSDPLGVQGASMAFVGVTNSCNIGGQMETVSGNPIGGLPGPLRSNLQPNAMGQVPTEWALLATVSSPLTCNYGNPPQIGEPAGATFIVQCSGQNWSSNPQVQNTSTTLTVAITP